MGDMSVKKEAPRELDPEFIRSMKTDDGKRPDEAKIASLLINEAQITSPEGVSRSTGRQIFKEDFIMDHFIKEHCSPHHIRECDLTAVVLDDLRRVTHFARQKEKQFAAYINQKNSAEVRKEINSLQRELDVMRKRSAELTTLFKRLYEDSVFGRITDEQFRLLSADYNAEQRTLEDAILEKEGRLEKLKASAANVDAFIEKARRYRDIQQLTPELLRLFIQRIEVGERSEKYSRHASQEIRIVYRDIGALDSQMEDGEAPVKLAPSLEEAVTALGYQAEGGSREDTTQTTSNSSVAEPSETAAGQALSVPA